MPSAFKSCPLEINRNGKLKQGMWNLALQQNIIPALPQGHQSGQRGGLP